MAQIYTHHQGEPVAVPSKGHKLLRAVAQDSTPRHAPPPKAGDIRRQAATRAKGKTKAELAERAREARNRARGFATGIPATAIRRRYGPNG